MSNTYLYFTVDGTRQEIYSEKPLQYDIAKLLIGGWLELVVLNPDQLGYVSSEGYITGYVDEEGYLKHLPLNKRFPGLYGHVLLGRTNKKGEFIGLTDKQLDALK